MDKRAVTAVSALAAMAGITMATTGAPPPAARPAPAAADPPPRAVAHWRPLPVRPAVAGRTRAGAALALPGAGPTYPVRRMPWSRRAAAPPAVTHAFPPRTPTGVCADPRRPGTGEPLHAVRCGQAMWNNHRLTGDQAWLDRAVTQAEWLVARHRRHGAAWLHPQRVVDGRGRARLAYTGALHGEALTLFARLAGTTAQPRWRAAADGTFAALLLPPGGDRPVVSRVAGDRLWLDRGHDPGEALAGHLRALTGAYELWRLTADRRALQVVRAALATVHAHLRGAGADATAAVVPDLLHLADLTGHAGFRTAAARVWTQAPPAPLPGTVTLRGTVTGYRLRGGRPVAERRVRILPAAYPPLAWRGRLPGSTRVWLRVRGGPLRDLFVAEQPRTAYVRGLRQPLDLGAAVGVRLPAGTPLLRYSGGRLGEPVRTGGRRGVTVDRVATVNGAPYARLTAGQRDGGRWIALRHLGR
ncbi:MAG TPA: hypothetical protein VFY17_06360 [Pilimelia sp.]|nr:hypothetical protein [Pilimelia sp.]